MFRKVDLGREISGEELGAALKRVAEEQGGKYGAWVTRGEDVLVLGSVCTEQRGGTLRPQIEVAYTAIRGRLTRSEKVICGFGKDGPPLFGEPISLGKDRHYRMVGLVVSVASKPIGRGRAIALFPIFGWLWAGYLHDLSLTNFSSKHRAQVEKDVVCPLLSRLGELLKSTSPQPSSA